MSALLGFPLVPSAGATWRRDEDVGVCDSSSLRSVSEAPQLDRSCFAPAVQGFGFPSDTSVTL